MRRVAAVLVSTALSAVLATAALAAPGEVPAGFPLGTGASEQVTQLAGPGICC